VNADQPGQMDINAGVDTERMCETMTKEGTETGNACESMADVGAVTAPLQNRIKKYIDDNP